MDAEARSAGGGSTREWLRGIEVFTGPLAEFDPDGAPGEPVALFLAWLREAVGAGAPAPHAATLSTVGEDGMPDARVLIVKNVDAGGWQFASHADSPKGRQVAGRPAAALTFFWPLLGRQVRVRGTVSAESAAASAADLLARSPSARAEALIGRQSDRLASRAEHDRAIGQALARIESDPALVAPAWTLYTLTPLAVEFWQADDGRSHTRLRYERSGPAAAWERHLLWP
ncbi:pyridoxal 5'-phosphate synthase [Streptomyces sp. RFCAC02]|uniref:pyridoxine/pyridoxamine 5'-phosphate oxidase n=1 Tax=Streptomyces sp. RFCAC02 TaxID=2499143 RepID=UPI00102012C1|nr:pyridoxal 5'-phosphate synthase [Streptomyces sp. RFCAC02]